jgi:hypothetical protein
MATKTLTGGYPSGYTLKTKYDGLYITSSASVGGGGVVATTYADVQNAGVVKAAISSGVNGVNLEAGGYVYNTGHIYGGTGLLTSGAYSTVDNFGSIGGYRDAVHVGDGGLVANLGTITGGTNGVNGYGTVNVQNYGFIGTAAHGSLTANAAVNLEFGRLLNEGTIYGAQRGVITYDADYIVNLGTIMGETGVSLLAGGAVVNGGAKYPGTEILGSDTGVSANGGTVTNNALIEATYGSGVVLTNGAELINGSPTRRYAYVTGYDGVSASPGSSIVNYGRIVATNTTITQAAVYLDDSTLTNGSAKDTGALVQGYNAVTILYGGTVNNFGVIDSTGISTGVYAIQMSDGGVVTNGSSLSRAAVIEGYNGVIVQGAAGTVTNFGTIASLAYGFSFPILLSKGGTVTNGSLRDQSALIEGGYGVGWAGVTTLTNFGAILGSAAAAFSFDGGVVVNGAPTDPDAFMEGYAGVALGGVSTVVNYGLIKSTDVGDGAVNIGGGVVINGSGGDTTATLVGSSGVVLGGAGTVTNYGLIEGQGAAGVTLEAGGRVVNGLGADRSALIEGIYGVEAGGAAATVVNAGTITGEGAHAGVDLAKGGVVTNGSASDGAALIEGYSGVIIDGAGRSANFGTISATGGSGHEGADLTGASLTNGSASDAGAVVEGYTGLVASGKATVTNFGMIDGEGGTAVDFKSATGDLVVEAGSAFIGQVLGGGGRLELGSGVGTLTGLFAGGDVTVSGSMATTKFTDFGTLQIDAPADFTLAGAGGTIATGQALILAGTLAGSGTLALTGGTSTFDTGADLTIAKVAESGMAVADFAEATITVADVWSETAGTVSAATGDKVSFTGTGDAFSGTLTGTGTIAFTGGTDTLSGTTLTATSTLIDGATVTLSGTIDLTKTLSVTSPDVIVVAAGATLSGKGIVSLSDATTNIIKGASASATLTNFDDKIEGAGDLGDGEMGLTNDSGGTIDAYLGAALTINLGTNTFTNAGLIENAGTGGLVIDSATDNTGTLDAIKGTLTVDGVVSGTGTVKIAGGTADFASAFIENVAFTTAGGVLELADATTYTGTITGFAKTSITSLDLTDIAFTGATVSYSGTTTSGVLTVKSGSETAKINLTGDYLSSTFTLGKDAGSGTIVTDPTDPPAKPPITTLPLVAAMAGFGGASGVSRAPAAEACQVRLISLAAPGAAVA